MRLDFNTFAITGPSTETLSTTKVLNGQVNAGAGKESNLASNCATDVFTITNAENLPEMCGTLTGEHGINRKVFKITHATFQLFQCISTRIMIVMIWLLL